MAPGQATARAAIEGKPQGAVAGIAMGFAAVSTPRIVPQLVPFLMQAEGGRRAGYAGCTPEKG